MIRWIVSSGSSQQSAELVSISSSGPVQAIVENGMNPPPLLAYDLCPDSFYLEPSKTPERQTSLARRDEETKTEDAAETQVEELKGRKGGRSDESCSSPSSGLLFDVLIALRSAQPLPKGFLQLLLMSTSCLLC